MSSIASEVTTLSPSAEIELFELDVTMLGGAVHHFHNGKNKLFAPVVWRGVSYTCWPIQASGFEMKADGPLPRPRLRIGNVDGMVGVLVRQYRKLKGARLIRRRTLVRYLDAINFPGGVNPGADPDAGHPDDLWTVDRLAANNYQLVEWELASPLSLEGRTLPHVPVQGASCLVRYRSGRCGYAGGPVATADDTPTSDADLDDCSLTVAGCKLRFGANAELPIFIFPAVGLVRQV